ncbi:MAG: hypothetical protein KGP28_07510 [Bdellovibrionales bacterium]|nr:hypothetical protein [Bdellovibrionales bacterium]
MKMFLFVSLIFSGILLAEPGADTLRLKFGYVEKLSCKGKLFVSAVGNEALVHLEALPKELGCGVILKPLQRSGKTNLILETSTGTVIRTVEVR